MLTSLLDLPNALIEGRIASRLTQKELGKRLGVPEQQVQRYEKTRYAGVSIERLQEVADALRIKLKKTVEYDVRAPAKTQRVARETLRSKSAPKTTASQAAKRANASDLSRRSRTKPQWEVLTELGKPW